MRTLDYRFQFDMSGTRINVLPVFNDDMALEYERETSEQFFRASLSQSLSFIGDTYDFIMAHAFETTFTLVLQHRNADGTWSDIHTSEFTLTDCTINVDDKRVTVKPRTRDSYTEIMAGIEREYNLIELLPEITPVTIYKRPMLQIYVQGEDILSCYHGGMWWEQQVQSEDDISTITDDYHFARTQGFRQFVLTDPYGVISFDPYQGIFPTTNITAYNQTLHNGTSTYLHVSYTFDPDGPSWTYVCECVREADDVVVWSYTKQNATAFDTSAMTYDMTSASSGTVACVVSERVIFSRILCDALTVQGQATYPISQDDFCYDNRNYRRVVPKTLNINDLVTSGATQAQPTEYGLAPNGQYYVRPSDDAYPIAKSTWNETSMWFTGTVSDNGAVPYVLRTCYPIHSVINVLVKKIAPAIDHQNTTAYSKFLYSSTNPISGDTFYLFITPKTNVLAGDNSQPAMKAPITLRTVLNMLRDVYGCYWHVDGTKFCIEHIKYYKQGGSYTTMPTVGIDLTQGYETRNGKDWAFGTNEYSYDKINMPERYQFTWMDDVSQPFKGVPIVVSSAYVEHDKIEETSIANFTSDIDYMLLAPEDISKDGFAVMACNYSVHGGYYTDIRTIDGIDLQNAWMAMIDLQPKYLLYDMPAWTINVNGESDTADGIKRQKRQKVNVPTGGSIPDTVKLVRTGLGDGSIYQMSLNLEAGFANITVAYDTAEQPS